MILLLRLKSKEKLLQPQLRRNHSSDHRLLSLRLLNLKRRKSPQRSLVATRLEMMKMIL